MLCVSLCSAFSFIYFFIVAFEFLFFDRRLDISKSTQWMDGIYMVGVDFLTGTDMPLLWLPSLSSLFGSQWKQKRCLYVDVCVCCVCVFAFVRISVLDALSRAIVCVLKSNIYTHKYMYIVIKHSIISNCVYVQNKTLVMKCRKYSPAVQIMYTKQQIKTKRKKNR